MSEYRLLNPRGHRSPQGVPLLSSAKLLLKPTVHKIRQLDFCYIKGSKVLVTCGAALNCLLQFLYVLHSTFLRTSVVKSVAMGLRNHFKISGRRA